MERLGETRLTGAVMDGRTLVLPIMGGTVLIAFGVAFDVPLAMVAGGLLMAGAAVLWRLSRG